MHVTSIIPNQSLWSFKDLLDEEKLISSLRESFLVKKSKFVDNLKTVKEKLLEQFNFKFDIKIDILFSDVFKEKNLSEIQIIPYTIISFDKYDKIKIVHYHNKIGYFTCTEEIITKFNIEKIELFEFSDLRKVISKLENSFKPVNVKFKQEPSRIKFKYSKVKSFWDIELFLNQKANLLFTKEVFYRHNDDDCCNFYFVENQKGQIQIFLDQDSSEFIDYTLKKSKILVGDFNLLEVFFKNVWNDGDNFEFQELGKQWKQRILDSWK